MNTSECPFPYATDELFVYSADDAAACDSNIVGYVVWLVFIIAFKSVQPIGYVWHWLYRRTRRGGRAARSISGRYPFVAAASVTMFALYLCFVATTSIGICNSTNGCPLALFSSLWVMYGIQATFFLQHLINLGERIIPMSRKGMFLDSSDSNEHQRDDSSKVETLQKLCIVAQYMSLLVVWIVGTPLAVTIGSGGNLNLYITLTFIFQCCYYITFAVPLVSQMQRLIKVVRLAMVTSPAKTWAIGAIYKMRRTQFVILAVITVVVSVTVLLIFRVIQPRWYIILLLFTAELCSSTFGFAGFIMGPFLKYWQGKKAHKNEQVANVLSDEKGARNVDPKTVNFSSVTHMSTDLRKKEMPAVINNDATEG
jgi:hypothetical protein